METVRGMVLVPEGKKHLEIKKEEVYVKLPKERVSKFRDEVKELQYRLKCVGGTETSPFFESIQP